QDVLDAVGNRRPTYEPRATGHVTEMVALMQRLIERGHAYADGSGSVYFDVASQPTYGSLTRQSLDAMRPPARRWRRASATAETSPCGRPPSPASPPPPLGTRPSDAAGRAGTWSARP